MQDEAQVRRLRAAWQLLAMLQNAVVVAPGEPGEVVKGGRDGECAEEERSEEEEAKNKRGEEEGAGDEGVRACDGVSASEQLLRPAFEMDQVTFEMDNATCQGLRELVNETENAYNCKSCGRGLKWILRPKRPYGTLLGGSVLFLP